MRSIAFISILCAMLAVPCMGGVINFDDGTADTPVGSFYSASLGVTFVNGLFVQNYGAPGSSGTLAVASETGHDPYGPFPYTFGYPERVQVLFDSPQFAVSLVALDVGVAGARIDAYDQTVGGTQVGYDEAFGVGQGVGHYVTLSVSGSEIRRLEIYQPSYNGSDGISADNLKFTVPEPSTCGLIGVGLLLVSLAVRRLKRA